VLAHSLSKGQRDHEGWFIFTENNISNGPKTSKGSQPGNMTCESQYIQNRGSALVGEHRRFQKTEFAVC
jgi:hypothetical protein